MTPRAYLLTHDPGSDTERRGLRALHALLVAAEASPAVLTPADLPPGTAAPAGGLAGIDDDTPDARAALPAIVRGLREALLREGARCESDRAAEAHRGQGPDATLSRHLGDVAHASARAVKSAAINAGLWEDEG